MIYIDILPVSLLVTTLGISSVPSLFALETVFKSTNNDDVEHKLHLDFLLL